METFNVGGVRLGVAASLLTPKISQALASGRYENAENRAIRQHVGKRGRVLDLGGGIGLTSVTAGQIVGGNRLVVVEANPELIPLISDNLQSNGVTGADVRHYAVVPQDHARVVEFHLTRGFWAGALKPQFPGQARTVEVRAVGFDALLGEVRPSVLICDLEGTEAELFQHPLPVSLQVIILELHPNHYDGTTLSGVFERLAALDFAYLPNGSRGAVVCFGRKKAPKT